MQGFSDKYLEPQAYADSSFSSSCIDSILFCISCSASGVDVVSIDATKCLSVDAGALLGLPSPFQQPVDLGGRSGSVMDLGFYGSYFCRSPGDIVAKIAYIRRLASRFPCLSAFTASELGLLFSQLLVRSNRGFPPLLSLDPGRLARLRCLPKPSREAEGFQIFLFDGRFLARVLTRWSFLRGSRTVEWGCEVESFTADFSGSAGVANIFLNSSSAAALAGALAVDTSAAGVWRSVPLLPLRGVCTLSASSADMTG
ncbi:hypothetical protein F2Q68_00004665 [Brassica cretica]|uniref:Uncharacterized protein n=1 Tax=Brassica cretica TaxID=69181 RepID=A0A8S9JNK3_BRACR|nr:hypothetical protein F2Q68_00004665 [Brassica cretica]